MHIQLAKIWLSFDLKYMKENTQGVVSLLWIITRKQGQNQKGQLAERGKADKEQGALEITINHCVIVLAINGRGRKRFLPCSVLKE